MHHRFDLFSDYFALRDNALTRTDPRVKVLLALSAIVAVVLSHRPALPLLVAGGSVGAMLLIGMPARLLALRYTAPLGIAAIICVLRPFFIDGDPLWVLPVGGWELTATREGVADGLLIGSRVIGSVSAMILLSAVTPAYRIFAVLRWARVPRTLVEVAMLMYRHIFTLIGHASDAISAARVRLGFSSARRAVSTMGLVAGGVLTQSLDQAERTHQAMRARGYRGELPMGRMEPLSLRGLAAILGGAALIAGAYLLTEGYVV